MYCGQYVDVNLLNNGIYTSSKPFLYSQYQTIEGLLEAGKNVNDMTGSTFLTELYFENLKQCDLVYVDITLIV